MQVKDIMSKQVICVTRSTTSKHLLRAFDKFHIFPLVPVVDGDNHLIGIVSFRNLIDAFSSYHPDVLKLVPFLVFKYRSCYVSALFRGSKTVDIEKCAINVKNSNDTN
jgi:CBS domain-containing protein